MCKRIITLEEVSFESLKYEHRAGGKYNPIRTYSGFRRMSFFAVIIADDNLFEGI